MVIRFLELIRLQFYIIDLVLVKLKTGSLIMINNPQKSNHDPIQNKAVDEDGKFFKVFNLNHGLSLIFHHEAPFSIILIFKRNGVILYPESNLHCN
jgi:hypothetical protein